MITDKKKDLHDNLIISEQSLPLPESFRTQKISGVLWYSSLENNS